MSDGDAGPSRSGGRPAGRPAKRKVDVPGQPAPGSDDDKPAGKAKPTRPARAPRPWYRRGSVWFAIIAAEAVVALVVSLRFTPSTDEVSLDGADLPRFCAGVADSRAAGTENNLTSPESARVFAGQAATYRRLRDLAPTEIRPDIDRLADVLDDLSVVAADAHERARKNPSFDVAARIVAEEARLSQRAQRADMRVRLAVRNGCGIELDQAPESTIPTTATTAGPNPVAPETTASSQDPVTTGTSPDVDAPR